MARLRAFFEIYIKNSSPIYIEPIRGDNNCPRGWVQPIEIFSSFNSRFFKALLFIRAGNLIHRFESYQDLRTIGGSREILPFTKSIIIGCSIRLCGLPFMSAFYSKEIIIERLLIYNLSFISYFVIILGVLITVFYRIRFILLSISRVSHQRSLFSKSDIDPLVNTRIIILIIPAITGGRFINLFLDASYLFLVRNRLKLLTLSLILLGVMYFYKIFKLNLFPHPS